MKTKYQSKMWLLAACCVLMAWGPGLQAQSSGKGKMLKNEMMAASQLKMDSVARAKLLAVIREMDAKYTAWEEINGADLRRLVDESRKGAISDVSRMMALADEQKKLKEEIKDKISKALTPEQLTAFNGAVSVLKIKETQKPAAAGSEGTKPGMTPRQAVITLGLPSGQAAGLKAMIVEYEEKSAAASKKRSEMIAEAQTLMDSKVPKEKSQGAVKMRDAQKVTAPPVSELDDRIVEKLSPEFGDIYRKLRAGEETGKEREMAAKVAIDRMLDGEFNTLCDVVFPLSDKAGGKGELVLRSKAVMEGLVTAMKPESTTYNRAKRMTLLELPPDTEIVDRSFPGLSAEQHSKIAEYLKGMIVQFKASPTDKEKREAFSQGFSKAMNVLSVEQRVWVVNEAEK